MDISKYLQESDKVLIEHCKIIDIIDSGNKEYDGLVDFRYYNYKTGKGFILFYSSYDTDKKTIEVYEDCGLVGRIEDGEFIFSFFVWEEMRAADDEDDFGNINFQFAPNEDFEDEGEEWNKDWDEFDEEDEDE